jgi:DNA-binding response OmpR family regulator
MRILIIEDEVKLANAIKRALELQNYAVDTAYDGNSGFDLAVGEEFDLIILDVMLPGIDGIQLCKSIREEGIHTPVLMLTAKGQITDKVTGLDVGADDYMIKPFSFEELFARIRALIRRPKQTNQSVLKIKDLLLDTISFKVKRQDQTIRLSSKEFAILEYLMRNKNSVISKDQLISHVWEYDTDVIPTVVEVHIKHLRDKLDKPFHTQLIQTIRGKGYTIEDEG